MLAFHIGIDPGKNGCITVVSSDGSVHDCLKLADKTEHDIAEWLRKYDCAAEAVIERICAMPARPTKPGENPRSMGATSALTFGQGYGFLRGLLVAMKIKMREVTPRAWQKAMACLSGGDKNVTKAAAQKLWPSNKFTHANSDATLIAEYGRRTFQ